MAPPRSKGRPKVVMTGKSRLHLSKEALADVCRRYDIRRLSVFGSVLRDDFRPDSDLDVLVEFEPGARPTYSRSPASRPTCPA